MIRALITQLVEVLESTTYNGPKMGKAIKSAREYLATEPSGERSELIAELRDAHGRRFVTSPSPYSRAADMLEADAQPKQVTCQIYGHVVGACVECNTHIEAQQAKRVPMTAEQIRSMCKQGWVFETVKQWVHVIEAHHGITAQAKKETP